MKLGETLMLEAAVMAGLLLITCDAVKPRSRFRTSVLAKARLSHLPRAEDATGYGEMTRGIERQGRRRASKFRPSVTRCCKIGERTARKSLSCNLDTHAVERQINVVHKAKLRMSSGEMSTPFATKELATRISSCAASKYSANFEKCCRYREQFTKEINSCNKDHKGAARKRCRQAVRRRYP